MNFKGIDELNNWELFFEKEYMSHIYQFKDSKLKENLQIVLKNSQHCDVTLLRFVAELSILLFCL